MATLHSPSMLKSGTGRPGAIYQRIVVKALVLFILVNLVFAWLHPLPILARFSVYNILVPGRVRLPFGENPNQAYNFSLYNLEAMFSSHELAEGARPDGEYRLILIGDSSVWGYLLKPGETLSAHINAANLTTADGRHVRAYNVGYPTFSLTKDLLMLEKAMSYQPDVIVWMVTLEAFPSHRQLASPIVQNNPQAIQTIADAYQLKFNPQNPALAGPTFWEQTILGQRRTLADVVRLQLYGPMWAATGIDQFYPQTYDRPKQDLDPDISFHDLLPGAMGPQNLAFDVLEAGLRMAGSKPVLVINEPMFISHGENSDIRYNFFYPRWAYDSYLDLMTEFSQQQGFRFVDFGTLIDPDEFTNTAVHLSPKGSQVLSQAVIAEIQKLFPD